MKSHFLRKEDREYHAGQQRWQRAAAAERPAAPGRSYRAINKKPEI